VDSIKLFSTTGYKGKRVAEINKRRVAARQGGNLNNPRAGQGDNMNNKLSNAPPVQPSGNTNKNTLDKSAGNTKKKRKSALKIVLIVVMIIVLGLAALFVALGFYVSNLDVIFPNIYVNGVRMSGMNIDEASDTLREMVDSTDLEDLFVSVSFDSGDSFAITGAEAGLSFGSDVFDPDAMAHELYFIGREGNFIQNGLVFIRSLFQTTEIAIAEFEALNNLIFDEEAVRSIVEGHTNIFNNSLFEDVVTINSDSITVLIGSRFEYANSDEIYELVVGALITAVSEQRNMEIEYTLSVADGNFIDLNLLYNMISAEPINSVFDPETLSATESSYGTSFDIEAAGLMLDSAEVGDEVVIPFVFIPPEITQEYLDGLLFRDVLGEVTTTMAGGANRLHNIALTAEHIHGTVLNPGDVFSFNQVVGRRTAERGFRIAGGFSGGRLVDQIGGGICQSSSTLYVITLLANLEVVYRRAHGMTVTYLPYGQDATVAYTANLDYRFRNNSDFPVRVEMEINGTRLTGRILGTRLEDYRIELVTRVVSRTPIEEEIEETEGIYEVVTDNPGFAGVVADVFKRFYDSNDNFLREELVGRSTYRMVPRLILVPIGGAPPPQNDGAPADGEQVGGGQVDGGQVDEGQVDGGQADGADHGPAD
jgi:hypothetical protein